MSLGLLLRLRTAMGCRASGVPARSPEASVRIVLRSRHPSANKPRAVPSAEMCCAKSRRRQPRSLYCWRNARAATCLWCNSGNSGVDGEVAVAKQNLSFGTDGRPAARRPRPLKPRSQEPSFEPDMAQD